MEKSMFCRGAASRPKLWGYGEIDTKDVGKVREGGHLGKEMTDGKWATFFEFTYCIILQIIKTPYWFTGYK